MLKIVMKYILPGKEAKLRAWLSELHERAEEVKESFSREGTAEEAAYILELANGPVLIYAMEVADVEAAVKEYTHSTAPIDIEHRAIMEECLGERVENGVLYNVKAHA